MTKAENLTHALTKIVHFCRAKEVELRETSPLDIPLSQRMAHFSEIRDRSHETYVEVGIEARNRIQEWCFEYLTRRRWTHLISVSQCAERLEDEIVFRFFKVRRPIEARMIARIISNVDKSIADGVKQYRYLWPCHICYGTNPAQFNVGPVRFRPMEFSADELNVALTSWQDIENSFRLRIQSYYKSYGWLADVSIEASDQLAAKRISILAVQTSLTSLKLLLANGGFESRIRMAAQQNIQFDRGELYFLGDEPHLSWKQDGGQAPFAEDWWENINQGANAIRLQALGRIVDAVTNPSNQTFLKLKYLNALRWFNDAVIDTNVGSRIAKFVTVLEALTGCNERDDLADTVGFRTATLIGGWPDEGSLDEIRTRVKRLYVVRSELVHGIRDPLALELGPIAADAASVAHKALVAFLDIMVDIGIDSDSHDHSRLIADFSMIRRNVERLHANLPRTSSNEER